MDLTRRRFLALTAGTGALALVAGLVTSVTGPVSSGGEDEEQLLGLVAAAIFATDPHDPRTQAMPTAQEVAAGLHARAFLMQLPPAARLQLRGLLVSLEHGSRLRTGRRFSQLSDADRQSVLAGLAMSRLRGPRLAVAALKAVCAFGYLTHEKTWAAIGYDGPSLLRSPPGSP